ncbi:MAG: hypothetical protein GQ532_11850 [Methylomarinum sp.]|nr:hypothetical protein [Methylomarinum sp.]
MTKPKRLEPASESSIYASDVSKAKAWDRFLIMSDRVKNKEKEQEGRRAFIENRKNYIKNAPHFLN